eukprot:6183792-Pleurochrysis_carterae.AAC.1
MRLWIFECAVLHRCSSLVIASSRPTACCSRRSSTCKSPRAATTGAASAKPWSRLPPHRKRSSTHVSFELNLSRCTLDAMMTIC